LNARRYDVAIAGGGPAGAVAGMISAQLGLRTIVLEAAMEPSWKPGEVLAPECNPILKELGLWGCLASRPDFAISCAGVKSSWGSENVIFREAFCEPLGAGWIIDRRAFEMFLSERAVTMGAKWIRGARVYSCERQNHGWLIASTGLSEAFVHARVVIDATGRPAKLARRLGARRIRYRRQIVTVTRWPEIQSHNAWLNVESAPDGWWYAVSDASGAQILARFGDHAACSPSRDAMHKVVAETHFLRSAFKLPPPTEPMHEVVLNAESTALDRCAGEGWLAVGDAAAAFDPIASQGLSSALASANAAAHAAYDYLQGKFDAAKAYTADMLATHEFYLDGVQQHYRLERRWSDQPFWKTRHADSGEHYLTGYRPSKGSQAVE